MKLIGSDGTVYPLDKAQIRIGRTASNDIKLADKRVSAKHASIAIDGDDYILTDLGSSNGTFVNEAKVETPARLKIGDVIRLGDSTLTAAADTAQAAPAEAATELDIKPPARPRAPAAPPPMPTPPAAPPAPPALAGAELKSRTTVYLLEILPAMIGVLGVGWIYAGQTTTGVVLLIGNFLFLCFSILLVAFTGIAVLCVVPLWLAVVIGSVVMLDSHVKKNPQLFR